MFISWAQIVDERGTIRINRTTIRIKLEGTISTEEIQTCSIDFFSHLLSPQSIVMAMSSEIIELRSLLLVSVEV